MTIKGIALDVEGTVVNNEPAHHGGWLLAAEEIGVHLDGPQEALEKIPNFSGGPDTPIIEQIYALLPDRPKPTDEQIAELLKRKWFHYDQLVKKIDLRPRPGFYEVLCKFRGAGLPVVLGTAVDLDKAISLLKYSGLAKFFLLSEIVLVTDVKHSKPAPDFFLETARCMNIRPHEQLVFEDSPRGVTSGNSAGSPVIGMPVYDNDVIKNRLRDAGAGQIFTSWEDIDVDELLKTFAH